MEQYSQFRQDMDLHNKDITTNKEPILTAGFDDEMVENENNEEREAFVKLPSLSLTIQYLNDEVFSAKEENLFAQMDGCFPYKAKAVADLFGINKQTLLNYTNDFQAILNIERSSTGHRLFNKQDIIKLHRLLAIKNRYKLTQSQLISYLTGDGKDLMDKSPNEMFQDMMSVLSQRIEESLQKGFTQLQENQKLLEGTSEQKLLELSDRIILKDQEIEEKNKQLEEKNKQIEELVQMNIKLMESIKDENRQLRENIELAEQQKKKKWFWQK